MKEKENLTPLRTFNTQLRKRLDLTLRKMATNLNVSAAFLSAIESGLQPIPEDYIEIISNRYELSREETKSLAKAIYETNGYVIISVRSPIWQDVLDYKVDNYDE